MFISSRKFINNQFHQIDLNLEFTAPRPNIGEGFKIKFVIYNSIINL
jgi:hypothetical protein